jgi:molecular chaperone HtpG
VVPYAINPLERPTNRVYLQRMLLSEHVDKLVPDWAYFVRCVVDTSGLRPVASREGLVDDDALAAARTGIGRQVRAWLVRLGATDPSRMARFISTHQLGLKALALQDDEMVDVVDRWLAFETNHGRMTAAEFRSRFASMTVVETVDAFRQVAPVAAAQGVALLNGGYTYDTEVLTRIARTTGTDLRTYEASDLTVSLDGLDPAQERAASRALVVVREALESAGCEVVLRSFDPASLPVLYLVDRDAAFGSDLRSTRERVDGLWSEVLGVLQERRDEAGPQLVLNHRNRLVRRLLALSDDTLVAITARSLYGQALLASQRPFTARDVAMMTQSFTDLLDRALDGPTSEGDDDR